MRGVCLPGTPAARSRHGLPVGRLPACIRSGVSPRDPVAESQSSCPVPLFWGEISPGGQLLFLGELAWFLAKLLAVTLCVFVLTQPIPALASVRTFFFSPGLSDGTICRDVVSLACPVPGAGGRHAAWASGLHGPRARLGRGSCGVFAACARGAGCTRVLAGYLACVWVSPWTGRCSPRRGLTCCSPRRTFRL